MAPTPVNSTNKVNIGTKSGNFSVSKPMDDYNNRSLYQRLANFEGYSVLKELDAYKDLIQKVGSEITLVDFGCSHGHNTILLYKRILEEITTKRSDLSFRIYFNDLPNNNFNQVFKCLDDPEISYNYLDQFSTGASKVSTYINGSSFYQPILPKDSVNFATSFWTLHWLPSTPPLLDTINVNGNYLSENERAEYKDIASQSLTTFFKCRAQELKSGGILTFNVIYFPNFSDWFEACWKKLLTLRNLGEHSFKDMVFPVYWRSNEEVLKSVEEVKDQFKLIHNQLLPKPNISFDFPSAHAVIYNNFKDGLTKLNYFKSDLECKSFLDEFMRLLSTDYPEVNDDVTLVVLQRI